MATNKEIEELNLEVALPLVETFDWDLRYIMGDSSSPDNKRFIAVVTLYCRQANGEPKSIQFQADEQKLDKLISELEKAHNLLAEQPS